MREGGGGEGENEEKEEECVNILLMKGQFDVAHIICKTDP